MIRPELFKITHHRTPWALAATLTILTLAVPAWLAIRGTDQPSTYLSSLTAVFSISASLLAAVYGAWLIGHEYRQGTLRRVVAVDARRAHLLSTKAAVGFATLVVVLAAVAAVGVAATYAAAGLHDATLVFGDTDRALLAGAFTAIVTAAIAYLMSIVFRSDTYAMLGALATMVILGPLLTLIPTVGDYTPYALTNTIASWIENIPPGDVGIGTAAVGLAAMLGGAAAGAITAFVRRDI